MRLKKLGEFLEKVFSLPVGERSTHDVNNILPILTMKVACLNSLTTDSLTKIIQNSKLQCFTTDDVITRQGDIGDTFYIIMRGAVSVLLDPRLEERALLREASSLSLPPATRQGTRQSQRSVHYATSVSCGIADDTDVIRTSAVENRSSRSRRKHSLKNREKEKDEKRSRRKCGVMVNSLGRYQHFGELALLDPERRRNASVIADEPTDVIAVPTDVFNETLKEMLEQDLEEKRVFLQTHPFFSKWTLPMQNQLQWSLLRSEHRLGDHVIRQGSPVTGIHFLVKGRAHLTAEPLRHRILFPEMFLKHKHDPFSRKEPQLIEKEDTTLSEMAESMRYSKSRRHILAGMDPLTFIRRADGYAAAEKVVFDRFIDLCIIEEGEVVCDTELLLGLDKTLFGITCSTACTLFQLDIKIFDRMIYRKSPYTLTMMKVLAEQKLARRIATSQGQRVPILAPLLFKIMDVRVVDPLADGVVDVSDTFLAPTQNPEKSARKRTVMPQSRRSKTVLLDWFVHGKTPLLQPITKDAIYYREMIQRRAKFREVLRQRGPENQKEFRSLERRVKDTFWANLKDGIRARNTMKRLKLQNSEITPAARWK